jgi:hypothetical protein
MGDPRSSGRHSSEPGRRGQLQWMVGLATTVAALAAMVAALVVHAAPAVSLPSSIQIGPTTNSTHVVATVASSTVPRTTTPTTPTTIVIVTPQAPVTDSNDQTDLSSKDGESSTTLAGKN